MSEPYTPAPEPAHRTTKPSFFRRHWVHVTGAVLAGVILGAAGAGGGEPANTDPVAAGPAVTATATVTVTASPPSAAPSTSRPAPKPSPSTPTIGEGTYLVGEDIRPGRYRTAGPEGGGPCYWARLSGTSGEGDDIIANGLPTGPAVITIARSDEAFDTTGCKPWRRI